MNRPNAKRYEQESIAFVGLMLFLIVLILIQMWLFTATVDNIMERNFDGALPAAAISLACLGVNVWMLLALARVDRQG